MKEFLENFSQWMRHKVRVVILKQWKNVAKRSMTIIS